MLFEYLKAVIYGIVEGITEWLPISSTGHLILLERIFSFNTSLLLGNSVELEALYLSMLNTLIQLAAVMAVVCFFLPKILKDKKKLPILCCGLIIATIPAAVLGLLLDRLTESLCGKSFETLLFCPEVVASALIVYGILFILSEKLLTDAKGSEHITLPKAFAIGCFQALAIIPGTSRSGATMLGARILGQSRSSASEFSFLMAVPVIFSASALECFDFAAYSYSNGIKFPPSALAVLLVACTAAFAVSLLSIKFLTGFVKKHSFIPFGIYRIILGVAVLLLL